MSVSVSVSVYIINTCIYVYYIYRVTPRTRVETKVPNCIVDPADLLGGRVAVCGLAGWLVGWLGGWLVDWLAGWLAGWLLMAAR